MDMFRVPKPRNVLVLAPHPDDEAVGCGGYLAMLAQSGARVTVVFVTDGAMGPDGQLDEARAERRRCESQEASKILGVQRILRWQLPDGRVRDELLMPEPLESVLVEERTELVLPPHGEEAHPDHAAVGRLAQRLSPAYDDLEVMQYEIWSPCAANCVVNISSYMSAKLKAIQAYQSQCSRYNLESMVTGLGMYRSAWARMRGWQYAESFIKTTLKQLRDGG